MEVVAGDVTGVTVMNLAGNAAKRVPDRGAAPVGLDRTLDLKRRGRHTPDEILGKSRFRHLELLSGYVTNN